MALQSLIPWRRESREISPTADPFSYLQRQINRIFDEPFGSLGASWPAGESLFAPQVDVTETEKEILVDAELPGLEPKNVEVSVDNDVLMIRGEKRSEETSGESGRRWTERTYGRFERRIPLPTEVKADAAKAEFKNGVLRITMPKSEDAKPRAHKIPIS